MLIDGEHIYICGSHASVSGNPVYRIEKRSKVTGDLETGFGTDGIYENNPSTETSNYVSCSIFIKENFRQAQLMNQIINLEKTFKLVEEIKEGV